MKKSQKQIIVKKRIIYLSIILILLLSLIYVCFMKKGPVNDMYQKSKDLTEEELSVINQMNEYEETNVPDFIGTSYKDSKIKEYKWDYINNYMSDDYLSEDINIYFSGFPTDENGYHLTKMVIKSNKYNYGGISLDQSVEENANIIKYYGFKCIEDNTYKKVYESGRINIELDTDIDDSSKVEKISISLDTIYLGNNIY